MHKLLQKGYTRFIIHAGSIYAMDHVVEFHGVQEAPYALR